MLIVFTTKQIVSIVLLAVVPFVIFILLYRRMKKGEENYQERNKEDK